MSLRRRMALAVAGAARARGPAPLSMRVSRRAGSTVPTPPGDSSGSGGERRQPKGEEEAAAAPPGQSKKPLKGEEALRLSAGDMVAAIKGRQITAEDLVRASVEKLQVDTAIYNMVTSLSTEAISQAAALDEHYARTGRLVGPLHGVPVLVADNIHVKGFPTTAGSKLFENYVPSMSAPVVEAAVAAGAVVVGKGNMDELGLGLVGYNNSTGTMTSPFDPNAYPGGSQGGSALAVATEAVPVAITTDVVGDSRIPASFCSIVAYVPTEKRYSRKRTWMLSAEQGTVAVMARTVHDLALVDSVLSASVHDDPDELAFHAAKPAPPLLYDAMPVLMVPEDAFNHINAMPVERAFEGSMLALQVLKCEIHRTVAESFGKASHRPTKEMLTRYRFSENGEDFALNFGSEAMLPEDQTLRSVPDLWNSWAKLLNWEAAGRARGICDRAGVGFQDLIDSITVPYIKRRLESFDVVRDFDVEEWTRCGRSMIDALDEYWAKLPARVDALIMPCVVTEALKQTTESLTGGLVTWRGVSVPNEILTRNTGPLSAAGYPCIVLPSIQRGTDAPVGLQLVGRRAGDLRLFQAAACIEKLVVMASREIADNMQKATSSEVEQVIPGSPAWLDDRSKNGWARRDDIKHAILKQGDFRYFGSIKLRLRGKDMVPQSWLDEKAKTKGRGDEAPKEDNTVESLLQQRDSVRSDAQKGLSPDELARRRAAALEALNSLNPDA